METRSNGLASSHYFEMDSQIVGDRFRIDVGWPLGANVPDKPLRVVYVMDGNLSFALAHLYCAMQARDLIQPDFERLLVVGVGYPNPEEMSIRRARDLTPENANPPELSAPIAASAKILGLKKAQGGADQFLKFLESELDPVVRANYPTIEGDTGIVGDSFGGLFTFHCFVKQSKLFNRFWLGSPGVFEQHVSQIKVFESLVQGKLDRDIKMFLTWGGLEETGPIDLYRDLAKNTRNLTQILAAHPNPRLTWGHTIYPGHTHTTVAFPAQCEALRFLYGPKPLN